MRSETAVTLGIIAVVVAVASLFFCVPFGMLMALGAVVLSILALRGGAWGWGIAGLVIAGLVFLIGAGIMSSTSAKLEKAGRELEKIGRELSEKCFVCNGTGVVDCIYCVNGRDPTTGWSCTFCNGYGRHTCTFCNGTGRSR